VEVPHQVHSQQVSLPPRRVLGLTKETLLVFAPEEQPTSFKLEKALRIKNLKEANASISGQKFKLEITCTSEPPVKHYFGGDKDDI
jgi:hypothetical protein